MRKVFLRVWVILKEKSSDSGQVSLLEQNAAGSVGAPQGHFRWALLNPESTSAGRTRRWLLKKGGRKLSFIFHSTKLISVSPAPGFLQFSGIYAIISAKQPDGPAVEYLL